MNDYPVGKRFRCFDETLTKTGPDKWAYRNSTPGSERILTDAEALVESRGMLHDYVVA